MDAYNAAIQISMPLNDFAWDLLKHRLIAQRDEAEQKELEFTNAQEASQLGRESRELFEEQRRLDQATNDRIWKQLGTPARHKLKAYADDHIATIWDGGFAVSAANSANFAADVLVHVVRRFDESIVEEDKLLASRHMRMPTGSAIPEMRQLKLDDIKWVYDESVRPHTERFGKEIFLCSICEGTTKRFTFDGVIQHFAAKHTSDLSKGTQVVHWKAPWPRNPPFQTFPETVWNKPPGPRPPPFDIRDMDPLQVSGRLSEPRSSNQSMRRPSTWAPTQPVRPSTLYDQHCEEVVESAIRAMEATENIKGLPDSVRIYVIIHLTVRSFCSKFPNEPSLTMFADCLNHKASLRQLRNLHDIRCKACWMDDQPFLPRGPKEYWLPDLLDHFHTCHAQMTSAHDARLGSRRGMQLSHPVQQVDWKFDMVELPPDQIIRNLAQAPGMDGSKFDVIQSIFPLIFASAPSGIERRQDYSLRRYYVPIDQDSDEYGIRPQPRTVDAIRRPVANLRDFTYEAVQGPSITEYHPATMASDFSPPSPGYFHRSSGREVNYRPRREIVYFDDHPEAANDHAYSRTVSRYEHPPTVQQPMPLSKYGGSAYFQPQSSMRTSPEQEGSRELPLRLLHGDVEQMVRGGRRDDPRSVHGDGTPAGRASVAGEGPQQKEDAANAVDNFLDTFDSLANREAETAVSMSRTTSVQRRSHPDNEAASVLNSRFSHPGSPGRQRPDDMGRVSQPGSRIDTPTESHASQYGRRATSRNSWTSKPEPPSIMYRSTNETGSVRPRTPPASQSPYRDPGDSLLEYPHSVDRYATSLARVRHEPLDSHNNHSYAATRHGNARLRYSPLQDAYDGMPSRVRRYVEVLKHDESQTFADTGPREVMRYEYAPLPPHEAGVVHEAITRLGARAAAPVPMAYGEDNARARQSERPVYAPLSSEPVVRDDRRRTSSPMRPGSYATPPSWKRESAR